MSEWSFELIFSGSCAWEDLAQEVTLDKTSAYIFDTDDHAVYVKMKKTIGPTVRSTPANEWFDPLSDPDNYSKPKFARRVIRIWRRTT
jgi:hypothetical protein